MYHVDPFQLRIILQSFQFGRDKLLVKVHFQLFIVVIYHVECRKVVVDGYLAIDCDKLRVLNDVPLNIGLISCLA